MSFNSDERHAELFESAMEALNRAGIFPDWSKDERYDEAVTNLHLSLGRIISMKVYEEHQDAQDAAEPPGEEEDDEDHDELFGRDDYNDYPSAGSGFSDEYFRERD